MKVEFDIEKEKLETALKVLNRGLLALSAYEKLREEWKVSDEQIDIGEQLILQLKKHLNQKT